MKRVRTTRDLQAYLRKQQRGFNLIARMRLEDVRKMSMAQKFDAMAELMRFALACAPKQEKPRIKIDLGRRMQRAKAYYRLQKKKDI